MPQSKVSPACYLSLSLLLLKLTYCSRWVYPALTNFNFFPIKVVLGAFLLFLGGGFVVLSAGLAMLEAKVLYLFA